MPQQSLLEDFPEVHHFGISGTRFLFPRLGFHSSPQANASKLSVGLCRQYENKTTSCSSHFPQHLGLYKTITQDLNSTPASTSWRALLTLNTTRESSAASPPPPPPFSTPPFQPQSSTSSSPSLSQLTGPHISPASTSSTSSWPSQPRGPGPRPPCSKPLRATAAIPPTEPQYSSS